MRTCQINQNAFNSFDQCLSRFTPSSISIVKCISSFFFSLRPLVSLSSTAIRLFNFLVSTLAYILRHAHSQRAGSILRTYAHERTHSLLFFSSIHHHPEKSQLNVPFVLSLSFFSGLLSRTTQTDRQKRSKKRKARDDRR